MNFDVIFSKYYIEKYIMYSCATPVCSRLRKLGCCYLEINTLVRHLKILKLVSVNFKNSFYKNADVSTIQRSVS